jgi:hypothetical protein
MGSSGWLESISSTPQVEARFLECDLGDRRASLFRRRVDRGRRRGAFDGRARAGIHRPSRAVTLAARTTVLRISLGAALRAALGIPRGSVRSQAIGVGADRLALAARAGRQRLAIGPEPGLLLARRLPL